MLDNAREYEEDQRIPLKGDRIELLQATAGIRRRGTVFHVDQEQILVQWDNGRAGSIRPGVDRFRVLETP